MDPMPLLQTHGKPISAATIRSGPGYLEVPFVATHEGKRGKGYCRCAAYCHVSAMLAYTHSVISLLKRLHHAAGWERHRHHAMCHAPMHMAMIGYSKWHSPRHQCALVAAHMNFRNRLHKLYCKVMNVLTHKPHLKSANISLSPLHAGACWRPLRTFHATWASRSSCSAAPMTPWSRARELWQTGKARIEFVFLFAWSLHGSWGLRTGYACDMPFDGMWLSCLHLPSIVLQS